MYVSAISKFRKFYNSEDTFNESLHNYRSAGIARNHEGSHSVLIRLIYTGTVLILWEKRDLDEATVNQKLHNTVLLGFTCRPEKSFPPFTSFIYIGTPIDKDFHCPLPVIFMRALTHFVEITSNYPQRSTFFRVELDQTFADIISSCFDFLVKNNYIASTFPKCRSKHRACQHGAACHW